MTLRRGCEGQVEAPIWLGADPRLQGTTKTPRELGEGRYEWRKENGHGSTRQKQRRKTQRENRETKQRKLRGRREGHLAKSMCHGLPLRGLNHVRGKRKIANLAKETGRERGKRGLWEQGKRGSERSK